MKVVRPPLLLRYALVHYTWNMGKNDKNVYLTFDDGPTPGVTEHVLDTLEKYNVKATFFCIGRNVERNIKLYSRIIENGHQVGNHTYSHMNGLKSTRSDYFNDVDLASRHIDSELFRPPYGRISWRQGKYLAKRYRVIMWDVLSFDYRKDVSPQVCYNNVISKVRNGSIVVFHDSVKAQTNMEYCLERTIEYLLGKGHQFKKITKE